MLVLNLPFKALMFLTLMRPSLVLFLVLWLKLVKDFLKVRCRSEERFSRNAETDLVCRHLLEKKDERSQGGHQSGSPDNPSCQTPAPEEYPRPPTQKGYTAEPKIQALI